MSNNSDVHNQISHLEFQRELGTMQSELSNMREDIRELKDTQKEFIAFMYQIKGGKAWLFGLLTVASVVGSIITSIFFHR